MRFFTSILIFFVTFSTLAQSNFKVPQIAPVPPDVANQLKYIEVPVTNYNGTSNFSVPLYNLQEGNLTLPISLSYSSSGLKVDEEASSVGLGWNLNVGGFIQFVPLLASQSDNLAPYGVDVNPSYEFDYQANVLQNGCRYQTPSGEVVDLDALSTDLMYRDGFQYPLYMYNFNGYSGKFFTTPFPDYQIITIDKSNIKFELIANGFKATTPDGVQYFFEESTRGSSIKNTYHKPCGSFSGVQSTSTSFTYQLTKMISPTNEVITFTYTPVYTNSLPSLSQWYTYQTYAPIEYLFTSTYSTHSERMISEINSNTTKIKFINSSRLDIYQGKKIDQIQVFKQGETTPLRTVNFAFDYFTGSTGFGDFMSMPLGNFGGCGFVEPQNFVTENLKSKRLKLLSVNINNIESYGFEYDPMGLPYKTSLAKDIWGYFNGVNNTTLLPNVNNLGYNDPEITTYFSQHPFTGDRRSRETYMKAGTLVKITQPTKGYTQLQYESNIFQDPPGSTAALIEVPVVAVDAGTGKDVKIFEVPSVQLQQYARVNIQLSCVGPGYPCSSGSCMGYVGGFLGPQDNRLYVLIEKQNTDGSWSDFRVFDRLSQEFDQYCTFVGYIPMPAGKYRMTASFPDDATNGNPNGGPWAQARLYYKDFDPNANQINYGAGLRIKSIVNFDTPTNKMKEQYYSYGQGKLMNKPDFIYIYDSNVQGGTAVPSNSQCTSIIDGALFESCFVSELNTLHNETLHSDAINPYSYNAMGGLIGYSQVTVSYGLNGQNGKEVFNYNNNYDIEFPYPGRLPGVTGLRKPDNGMIREKFVYRNSTPAASTANFQVVQYEKYLYEVRGYKKYWNYKSDYHPTTGLCDGNVITSQIADLSRTYLHFFPIVVGKVCLKSKIVDEYDMIPSGVPSKSVSNTTTYNYNSKNQLVSEQKLDSGNEMMESKTYYPSDLLSLNIQPTQMQELVDLNRIDLPIRTESYQNGVKISESQTKYAKGTFTGNILLPVEEHIKKGSGAIDVASVADRRLSYSQYDAASVLGITVGNGKILQYLQDGGVPVSFIWGYNKSLPVAKIENLAYSSIPANLITAIQTATDTGTEQQVLDALNALRTNVTLASAMVTGYVYEPLVGVRYIISPNGVKSSYEYDSLGRLKTVKDNEDKLLKEIQYYYRPN